MTADRLSYLPKELIYHIFSFLDMREVVHTSVLSSRWRHLWLNTPTLLFDCQDIHRHSSQEDCLGDPSECHECIKECDEAVDFVDRMLILSNSTNIIKFELIFSMTVGSRHIYTWLIAALGKHAQQIILKAEPDEPLDLPHHLFSPNIRELELMFYMGPMPSLPNSFSRAIHLKSLKLCDVVFPDGNSNGEFILSCPVLKHLRIQRGDISHLMVLTISTRLLESLELISMANIKNNTSVVKTCTPNLKWIEIGIQGYSDDYGSVDFCLENLVNLVSANISVGYMDDILTNTFVENLLQVFTGIHNIQSLTICGCSVQVLAYILESSERHLKLLQNLRYVKVIDDRKMVGLNSMVQAVLMFLERLPRIENLVWERNVVSWRYEEEAWVENLTFENKFNRLKSLEYRNFLGAEVELKFLEYLLQRAIVLEETIIMTARLSSLYGVLAQYKDKLLSLSLNDESLSLLPRASASGSVSYQLRS